jgi:hypothetical protein
LFIAPAWVCLIWPMLVRKTPIFKSHLQLRSSLWLAAGLLAMISIAFALGWRSQAHMNLGEYVHATLSPPSIMNFSNDALGLFSGEQVYYSMSLGEPHDMTALIAKFCFTAILMPMVYLIGRTIYIALQDNAGNKSLSVQIMFSFGIGTVIGGLCFLLLGGPEGLKIGYERYGLWLVAPVVILTGISLQRRNLIRRTSPTIPTITWAEIGRFQAVVILVAFAILFQFNMEMTGGRGHKTYRTGTIEPKQQRFQEQLSSYGHIELKSYDTQLPWQQSLWWEYWAARYLTRSDAVIEMSLGKDDVKYQTFDPIRGIAEKKPVEQKPAANSVQ